MHAEERHAPAETREPPQWRALFYVFDGGTGVGHLRRLACIARQMQGRFACLVVTGHRAAAHWFVPAECEYLRLPGWDGLFEDKARYWGRKPFMAAGKAQAIELRREILEGAVRGFRPDAIFVDHLPLGMEEELASILATTPCRKYLVTRGVLNETEDLRRLILGGKAHDYLRLHYHRIFAAADPKVFDFPRQYNVGAELRAKTVHTGYVTQALARGSRARMRAERGVGEGDIWVVASAGGGQHGEALIEACINLAGKQPGIFFDIVMGPRSRLPWGNPARETVERGRMRLHKETSRMSCMNASADLVITSGGYNTMLEALQGQAALLCFPLRKDPRDEQYQHAARLRPFVNIDVSTDLADLPLYFERALARLRHSGPGDRRHELDFRGAERIQSIVEDDLAHGVGLAGRARAQRTGVPE